MLQENECSQNYLNRNIFQPKIMKLKKGGFTCVVHGETGVTCYKDRQSEFYLHMPLHQVIKYEQGITTHVGANSLIHYFKYNL
jgi:hypothetical protein